MHDDVAGCVPLCIRGSIADRVDSRMLVRDGAGPLVLVLLRNLSVRVDQVRPRSEVGCDATSADALHDMRPHELNELLKSCQLSDSQWHVRKRRKRGCDDSAANCRCGCSDGPGFPQMYIDVSIDDVICLDLPSEACARGDAGFLWCLHCKCDNSIITTLSFSVIGLTYTFEAGIRTAIAFCSVLGQEVRIVAQAAASAERRLNPHVFPSWWPLLQPGQRWKFCACVGGSDSARISAVKSGISVFSAPLWASACCESTEPATPACCQLATRPSSQIECDGLGMFRLRSVRHASGFCSCGTLSIRVSN